MDEAEDSKVKKEALNKIKYAKWCRIIGLILLLINLPVILGYFITSQTNGLLVGIPLAVMTVLALWLLGMNQKLLAQVI